MGLTVAMFVTRTFWLSPGPDYRLDQARLAAIEVIRQRVSVKDGKLVVSGTVVNRNKEPVQQLEISSVVTENGKPIEHCSAETYYGQLIKPSEEFDFVSFCRQQWSTVAEDSLAAQTKIDRAYEQFSIRRN